MVQYVCNYVLLCLLADIAAFPDSVNALPDIAGDLRTPDKLVDGVCDTLDGGHMWLAPILPGVINSVYVVFDQPRAVSKLLLWNYGKTHSRGVKEMAVSVRGREGGREGGRDVNLQFFHSCWWMIY